MRRALKTQKNISGFTLIEIAISLVLIGLVIAPAASLYHQYRVEKDWEDTEERIDLVLDAIGGYRSIYGRYPCPSPSSAAPGDVEYGHEDCATNPVLGTCANGICRYASNIAPKEVLSGNIPFKTLNLQENDVFDRYLSRFDYAVTRELTDTTTFNMSQGGIGVVDLNNDSILGVDDTAHFIVISHGPNKIGGVSRAGVVGLACTNGSTQEQENCDTDTVYTSAEIADNYDDRTFFYSAVQPSEWQFIADAANNPTEDIHLKNTNSVALGAGVTTDLATEETLSVLKVTPTSTDTGFVKAEDNFFVDNLCEDNGSGTAATDCFEPTLIAGSLGPVEANGRQQVATANHGISCYDSGLGQDNFLAGVQNKTARCTDEVFISCPNGQSIKSIDSSGRIDCAGEPPSPCATTDLARTCGGSDHTLTDNAPSGTLETAFSGECRTITHHNNGYYVSNTVGMTTLTEFQGFVDTMNSETRTVQACSTVRDVYRCNAGNWSSYRVHEKGYDYNNFTSNLTNNGGHWRAETSYSGSDASNNNHYHDCWCREDYRVYRRNCPSGQSGDAFVIQRHNCPQTRHNWRDVYVDETNCGCVPTTAPDTMTCNDYYDQVNGTSGTSGLSGTVHFVYPVTCVGGVPQQGNIPNSVDASACQCDANAQIVNRSSCPFGETNNWSWPGGTEVGVQTLSTQDWVCPATQSGGLPDPGYYAPPVPYAPIPSCSCDASTPPEPEHKDCDDVFPGQNLAGPGVFYEKEWDCATGAWELEADWEETSVQCYPCAWQAPSGAPQTESSALGGANKRVGHKCTCGSSATKYCWNYGDSGDFDVWTNCSCSPQIP